MAKERIRLLDAGRGLAVALMVVFHAFFTLGMIVGFSFFRDAYLAVRSFAPPVISTLFIFSCAYSCLLSRNNLRRGLVILAVALGMSFVTIVLLPLWQMGSESTISRASAIAAESLADEDAQSRALRAALAAGDPDIKEGFFFSAGISRNDYLR